ncbi:MAG TPA: Ig-like domain-containing protein [Gemmatimonadales bacterium]|jgi:hypothetical protein|nr:Ig-like domain-containing protein [Gemmatimonadales bacterium]
MHPSRRAVLAFLTGITVTCADPTGPGSSATVEITNFRSFLEVGDSYRLVAAVSGRANASQVAWSSSDPLVITVDQTGLAVARSPGFSYVTASVRGSATSVRIAAVKRIAALEVEPRSVDLVVGDRSMFTAAAVDALGNAVSEDGSDRDLIAAEVLWSVTDQTIARFDDSDHRTLLRGLREGETTVRARLLAHTGTAALTVQLLEFAELAAGGAHTCGLATDSFPYCWGAGTGFLGSPGTGWWSPAHVPHRAGYELKLVSITAGGRHACGLTPDGEAHCWGSNEFGALGAGTTGQPTGPVAVSGGLRFTSLSAGGTHTCGIASTGQVFCWGARHGALLEAGPETCGTGGKVGVILPCSRAPLMVGDGSLRPTSLSTGGRHTCALDGDGHAHCWGVWGSRTEPLPVPIGGSLVLDGLASGDGYTCGLTPSGQAQCWGANDGGQLGDGSTTPSDEPVPVAGGLTFARLSAGRSEILYPSPGHVCGVTAAGAAFCWGSNASGELGLPSGPPHTTPVQVNATVGFRSVHAGGSHTCGMSLEGVAYCWGDNYNGQLGVSGVTGSTPVAVVGQRFGGSP